VIKLSENPIKLQVFYEEKQENPDEIIKETSFFKEEPEFPLMLNGSVIVFSSRKSFYQRHFSFKDKNLHDNGRNFKGKIK